MKRATVVVQFGELADPRVLADLATRQVHNLARETATLDWLSSGRLAFGAGLAARGTANWSHTANDADR